MIPLIYKNLCPNCLGDITSERLIKGLLCERCNKDNFPPEKICNVLKKGEFLKICKINESVQKFNEFFREKLNLNLNSVQKNWAVKFFSEKSFALLAPTGIGKTTFGIMLSIYLKKQNKKSYLIFPTQILVNQAFEKIKELDDIDEIIAYSSKYASNKRKQEEIKEKIKIGNFSILITTTMFLYKNSDIIPKGIFDLIFVDDVDSILKSAKNIDKILQLMNFSEEDVDKAIKFIYTPLEKRDYNLIKNISNKRKGVLIVSSATANPKSKRVNLFKELLGFEIGKPSVTLRNVEDVYEFIDEKNLWEKSINLIKKFKKGGLIFLPSTVKKEKVNEYINFLNNNGVNSISYEDLDRFNPEIHEVIVGIASYRNPLARGVNIPEFIRYAIFVGVPKLKFSLRIDEDPVHLYFILLTLKPILEKFNFKNIEKHLNILRKNTTGERIKKIRNTLSSLLLDKNFLEEIENSEEINLTVENGEYYIVIPDVTGYIQASGRTSRLYLGGLTKGLSYLLVDDRKAFYSLKKKVRWINEEIEFKDVSEVNIDEILKEIDADREKLRKKDIEILKKDIFETILIIVESPNKARTISNFFGRPLKRKLNKLDVYEISIGDKFITIVASKGHLFDLNKEEHVFGVINSNNNFIPIFEPIDEDRFDYIKNIRMLNLEVDKVYLATDPDTEGEKISYDILLNSITFNKNIKRIEFHEVTKKSFLKAISEFRDVDENLVRAQLIRRVADRWIGFLISQYIQKKLNNIHLSAGRVQTPVLEWIIERAKIAKKKKVIIFAYVNEYPFEFEFENYKDGKSFYDALKYVIINEKEKKEEKLFTKPFSTDTLLREAAVKLKFSPQKTMELAQDLFEAGFITYHRTDSIRVSDNGIFVAREYIVEKFGEEYFSPKTFLSSGGAHECIRPTRPVDKTELANIVFSKNLFTIKKEHLALYDLIFKQFIASQMREVVVEKTAFIAKAFDREVESEIVTKIISDGYNIILPVKVYSLKEGKYSVKKYLKLIPQKPYFTFATIIEEMKKKGIGRPSTYAITVQKLFDRKYIIERKGNLYPTPLGEKVLKILKQKEEIYKFVNEKYTRELEKLMDDVQENKVDYNDILKSLYKELFENEKI